MIAVIGYIAVMAIVYFVVPIGFPSVDITVIQSAAITFLVFMARVLLTEGVTVRLQGIDEVKIEQERE